MKKSLVLLSFLVISIFAVNLFYFTNIAQISSSNSLMSMSIQTALAIDNEVGVVVGTKYSESSGDCSITLSGAAGVTVTLFGRDYVIPASGSITLTFSSVTTICNPNGTFDCKKYNCANFWKD